MNKFIYLIMLLFLSSCSPATKEKTNDYIFCVHNGYSSWQPCCKELNTATWGILLNDCTGGIKTIINPTNITVKE